MRLAETTSADAPATDLAVLPVGATEQHGPHAPLGTDSVAATAVAEAGAERVDRPVVVGPTVPVGVSEEHRSFPGTLWVTPDTFRAYVRETVASLASHGYDRVVLANGHGGNVGALREVAARLTRDGTACTAPFTWFEGVADMGHAGPVETSLLLHTDPDLVATDRIERAREGAADRWGEWVAGTDLAHDTEEFAPNGVVGDPGEATAERGADLLAAAGEALADVLVAVGEREWP
jgi:creatinine amidohydrolase